MALGLGLGIWKTQYPGGGIGVPGNGATVAVPRALTNTAAQAPTVQAVGTARTADDVFAEAVVFYEADDVGNDTTTEAGFFTSFNEKNGGTDVGAVAGERPAVLDTAGVISAEYDAINDRVQGFIPALQGIFNTGGTYIGVVRPDTRGENSFGRLWSIGGSDTERMFVGNGVGGNAGFFLTADHETTDGLYGSPLTYALGAIHIIVIRHDKGNPSNIRMRINGDSLTIGTGITEDTVAVGAAATPSGNLYLGNNNATNRTFDGGKYLDAFWDTLLSDSDVELIVARCVAKYQA